LDNFHDTFSEGPHYPPKPIQPPETRHNLGRSLISLAIYAFLFYFLFGQNIAYIAALLLVLLIHEFGHFFAMKIYNYSNVKLFIIPLVGAFVSGKKQRVSQKQMSIILMAGPVPGLIIGFILYFINRDVKDGTLAMLANTFIFLNLFNLLPIYPLDGGRLLETLFIRNNYGIRLVFTILSLILLVILIVLSGSYLMLVIPLLMGMELNNEIKNRKIGEYLDQEKINYHCDYNDLPDKNYWLIRDCILFSFPKKFSSIEPGKYEYTPSESILMHHVTNVLKVDFAHDLGAIQKVIFLMIYLFFLLILPLLTLVLKAL
jgi:stage IV sporulation protein FB